MTTQNNAAQAQTVLTDAEIREIQGTHLVTISSRDALIASVIVAGRAIEAAVLSKLRAPVADERAAFEWWASDEGEYPASVERDGNGNYKLAQIQAHWDAWQARAALASAPVADGRSPKFPVPYPKHEDITEDMRDGFERLYAEEAKKDYGLLNRNSAGAYMRIVIEKDWIFYQRAWADALASAPTPDERTDDTMTLLGKYKALCIEIGRGDSYHLGRIDAAIAALASAPVAGEQIIAWDVQDTGLGRRYTTYNPKIAEDLMNLGEDVRPLVYASALPPANAAPRASAPVAGEARPTDRQEALRITELPDVDEALATFCSDGTQDNAVGLVLAILSAAPQASAEDVRIRGVEAARFAYASEFAPDENGDPDVGSIHANIRKLKAELANARNAVLEEVAAAVENHQRAGRQWIPESLWGRLSGEAAARIRALKTTPAPTAACDHVYHAVTMTPGCSGGPSQAVCAKCGFAPTAAEGGEDDMLTIAYLAGAQAEKERAALEPLFADDPQGGNTHDAAGRPQNCRSGENAQDAQEART